MITEGEQKPGAGRETNALGPSSARRPEIRKEPPFLVVRKSFYGYLVASLTVLMLWGTLALGVVGCSNMLSRFGWLQESPGASTVQVRHSSREISRLLRNARYYKLMGRPDLAFKELEQAHQQDPDNLKIINSLAQNYEEQGKFETARQLYREGLTRHGPNPVLTNNLCFTYYLEGRYQKAEECFRQALARDPQNVAVRNNLGLLYCRQGHQDKAWRLWRAAEGDATADYKVHQALAALGMYDGAVYAQRPEPVLPAAEAKRVASMRPAAVAQPDIPVPAKIHPPPQPVAPKATNGSVAQEPAPKIPTPVANRVSPSSGPEVTASRPLASQPGQVHASQSATPKKAALQVAQKTVHPVAGSSNMHREKAPVYTKPQPVAPKATTRPVARKPAPKSTTQVATRLSPSSGQEATASRPLASQPEQVHASQSATLKKAALQVAQKTVQPVARSSNTHREKAQVYANPQPLAPKATTRPVALKPAPKSTTPVATKLSPSSSPEATAPLPLASQPEQIHASQSATPKKASLQVAQKTVQPVTGSSNTHREKAQVYANPQPLAPKATTRPVALKPAPKSTTPVATKINPSPRPVGIARLATRISAKVHALARLVATKKSSQQSAQRPAAKMPVSSVTPQGKVLDQAALEQTRLAMVPIVAGNAPPLMYPRYLTCAELVNTPIEVRNGTWTRNLAHETRSMLSLEGFNVTEIGNHIDFGAKKTIIFYRPRSGRVARALGHTFFPMAELKPSMNLKKDTDVKILLGADLLVKPQRLIACLGSERR